ncbi:MAG: hypothetical protein P9M06_05015 [Candidatus Saelkia tenebricola]|nr:hypothetical protein [Candidatus Saelkia tenebricola]
MRKNILWIFICLGVVIANFSEARRIKESSVWRFFQTEPTKSFRIAVDFNGTIVFGSSNIVVREGILDLLGELKDRGHVLILATSEPYQWCIDMVPGLEALISEHSDQKAIRRILADFIIDDDINLMNGFKEIAEHRGEDPDKHIIIPAPNQYDAANAPLGYIGAIVDSIQNAGG